MTLEQAEALWRAARPTSHRNDELLHEIKRAARQFSLQILFRDCAELIATLLVVGIFVYAAMQPGAPRVAYLIAAGLAVSPILFLGVNRWLKRESRRPSGTVRQHIEQALREVQNQLWLLQRVLWWYLLPLAMSAAVFMIGTLIRAPGPLAGKLIVLIVGALVCAAVGVFIWRLNRLAIRTRLEPFANHLRGLATALQND